MSKRSLGVMLAITSAIIYGAMPLVTKSLYQLGGNEINLVFLRCFSVVLLLFCVNLFKKQSLKIDKKLVPTLAIAGLLGVCFTSIFLFASYHYIASGMATTLHFAYPVIVASFGIFFAKEKTNPLKHLAVVLAGIGLILLFDLSGKINILGLSLALISAFTYSAYILMLANSKIKSIKPLVAAFYINLFSCIFTACIGIALNRFHFDFTPANFAFAFICCLIIGFGGSTLFQLAVNYVGAESAAILSTFEPLTSVLLGAFVLHETFTGKMSVGMLLILSASFIIILMENRVSKAR